MNQPHESPWQATKRILRYVSGTKFYRLFYNAANDSNVVAYTDADWAGSLDIEKNLQDMFFFLEEILFLGAAKNNPLLLYLQLKQNILQHYQQAHNKIYGSIINKHTSHLDGKVVRRLGNGYL